MRLRVMGLLAAWLAAAGPLPAADKKEDLAARLKGTWTLVRGEKNGQAIPPERIKGSVVVFTADKVLGTDKDRKEFFSATYTLDTTAKPWVIRMTGVSPKKGDRAEGIVEVDGDTAKVCYGLPGEKRPASFKAGAKQHCFVLKRAKDAGR